MTLYIVFFIFGSMIGSFLNAVIYRLPRKINIAFPRSHCTNCKKLIYWYENIPILSYIFLRGKCSKCKSPYSAMYPAVEILIGVVAVLLIPDNLNSMSLMYYFLYFSLFCALFCHFIIDIKHQILPDSINIYIAVVLLCISFLKYSPTYYFLGALIGFLFPYLVTLAFYYLKGQQGLGGGDIKLFAALGILLGPVGIINNIFLSCFFGALFSLVMMALGKMSRNSKLAFGPFIIIVAVFQVYFPTLFRQFSSLWSI
ncbi:A24 family peptidase [Halobacteriovorax sp. JY17]|uniref:prepilin peptidase n=1 Tax=Halobacteriovorax sp. JY17 TaxID=2014617 RepID=UPI000C38AB7A|nr:A24 family peptidase [Halobacteriovorax sp. JY17]PIK14476.1 MAG: prepilin peptidase [Halobacteriovorax sp. JY17]